MKAADMNRIKALFDNYNEELARQYEDVLLSFPRFASTEEEQAKIYDFVQDRMKDWQKKSFRYRDTSETPENIIGEVDEPQQAFEIMRTAAIICDDGIPPFVKNGLSRYKGQIENLAAGFITDINWNELDERADYSLTSLPCSVFISLFTEWEYHTEDIRLLDKLNASEKPSELITDALRRHLRDGGQKVIGKIISLVNGFCLSEFRRTAKRDVLMLVLVETARDTGSTQAYRCLRNCFLNIREKVFAAICLSDMGDSRGADFLKEWLKDNYMAAERKVAVEVINSIEKLGGDAAELKKLLALETDSTPGW